MASYLHHLSEKEQEDVVQRLLADKNTTSAARGAAKSGLAFSKSLPSVLQILTAESDYDKFADLKMAVDDEQRAEVILKREGLHREKAAEFTPLLIKNLRPKVPGCCLNWQPALCQFAGYFRKPADAAGSVGKKKGKKGGDASSRKSMHSTARLYGGKWTQLQALNLVVAQLWKWNQKYGGAS